MSRDAIATFQGAEWLLHALHHAESKKLVVLGHGSHTIQYEIERERLYRELEQFLDRRQEELEPCAQTFNSLRRCRQRGNLGGTSDLRG